MRALLEMVKDAETFILPLRYLPNLITLLRLLLVGPIVWAILQERFGLAFLLFLLAGLSDGLDGFLAKRFGWQSRLGALLDPIADKALLVSVYWAAAFAGILPLWLVLLIALRDLAILLGAAYLLWRDPGLEIRPLPSSKLNTALQILYLLSLLLSLSLLPFPSLLLSALQIAVVLSTVGSGLHYALHFREELLRS